MGSSQPTWLQCELKDAIDKNCIIKEKLPVVTTPDLNQDSKYLQEALIASTLINQDKTNNIKLAVIDTSEPWGIEAVAGQHEFTVRLEQLIVKEGS